MLLFPMCQPLFCVETIEFHLKILYLLFKREGHHHVGVSHGHGLDQVKTAAEQLRFRGGQGHSPFFMIIQTAAAQMPPGTGP